MRACARVARCTYRPTYTPRTSRRRLSSKAAQVMTRRTGGHHTVLPLLLFELVVADDVAAPAQPRPCTHHSCTGVAVPQGCVHDGAASRQMNAANYTDHTSMTQAACWSFCRNFDPPFPFAGLENSNQCFCGTHLPSSPANDKPWCATPDIVGSNRQPESSNVAPVRSATRCNSTTPCHNPHEAAYCCCPGNATESCGGTGILELFDISKMSCGTHTLEEPWCDDAQPQVVRVAALINAMTPAEKVDALGAKTVSSERLGVSMQFKEALHGLRFPCVYDVASRKGEGLCPTSFPHAQLLAASFNRTLWFDIGDRISTEARAWHNVWQSGKSATLASNAFHALSFFAPDINLCRDPRWGRCLEVPSECPLLTGEYAMGFVHSMQQRSIDGQYFKVLTNAKHFSSYDVEKGTDNLPGQVGGGTPYDRGKFNGYTSRQDMIETYWPQFRAAVHSRLAGTMCSYNAVCLDGINGGQCVPSCANSVFNNEVLREKLGFTGMIVSDCGAINGIRINHNYSQNIAQAGLRGGCDVDCGTGYAATVPAALHDGSIDESDVDQALNRTLSQLISLGLANIEPPAPWGALDENDIDTPAHRSLAKDAAMQGFVLLKNEGLLPLRQETVAKVRTGGSSGRQKLKVAVLGPHLNSSTHLLANYYGGNDLVKTQTPLMGIERRPEVHIVGAAEGVPLCGTFCGVGDIPAAVALARQADVAILFVGLHSTQGAQSQATNASTDVPGQNNGPGMEREGYDRTNLTLPPGQEELIKSVSATGVKVAVVLINSGGVACEGWLSSVSALLEAYYPGEMGGDAIASVLFGDVSPSGRLTTTVYYADFIHQRNITDMVMRPHGAIPGITYRFLEQPPLFEFGFGLSYTRFSFKWASSTQKHTIETHAVQAAFKPYFSNRGASVSKPDDPLLFTVNVKNTGSVESDVVVLCFVSSSTNHDGPRKQLAGFERVSQLTPGTMHTLPIGLAPTTLTTVSKNGTEKITQSSWRVQCGGAPDGFAVGALEITGDDVETFALPVE